MIADTFGAVVFCRIGMDMIVRHQLELSCTITVQVPGIWVTVELLKLSTVLAVGSDPPGAIKEKLQVAGGVWVLCALMIEMVVEFNGEQPTENPLGLPSENVGHAFSEVTVTVLKA